MSGQHNVWAILFDHLLPDTHKLHFKTLRIYSVNDQISYKITRWLWSSTWVLLTAILSPQSKDETWGERFWSRNDPQPSPCQSQLFGMFIKLFKRVSCGCGGINHLLSIQYFQGVEESSEGWFLDVSKALVIILGSELNRVAWLILIQTSNAD